MPKFEVFTEDVIVREEVFTCTEAGSCRLKVLYNVYTHTYILYSYQIYDKYCRWRVRECASVFALPTRRSAHARTAVQFDLDPTQPTTRRPSPIGPQSRARRSFIG